MRTRTHFTVTLADAKPQFAATARTMRLLHSHILHQLDLRKARAGQGIATGSGSEPDFSAGVGNNTGLGLTGRGSAYNTAAECFFIGRLSCSGNDTAAECFVISRLSCSGNFFPRRRTISTHPYVLDFFWNFGFQCGVFVSSKKLFFSRGKTTSTRGGYVSVVIFTEVLNQSETGII